MRWALKVAPRRWRAGPRNRGPAYRQYSKALVYPTTIVIIRAFYSRLCGSPCTHFGKWQRFPVGSLMLLPAEDNFKWARFLRMLVMRSLDSPPRWQVCIFADRDVGSGPWKPFPANRSLAGRPTRAHFSEARCGGGLGGKGKNDLTANFCHFLLKMAHGRVDGGGGSLRGEKKAVGRGEKARRNNRAKSAVKRARDRLA